MSTEDFCRVNLPRVAKIISFIEMIEKSAKSYKVEEQVLESALRPIHEHFDLVLVEEKKEEIPQPVAVPPPPKAQAVKNRASHYAALPTSDLIDILASAGYELAKRRC